jgi:S1-C subfamily serine protease
VRGGGEIVSVGEARVPVGGDVIRAIDGAPVGTGQDLTLYLDTETRVGDVVQVTLWRDGEELVLPVTLTGRPRP